MTRVFLFLLPLLIIACSQNEEKSSDQDTPTKPPIESDSIQEHHYPQYYVLNTFTDSIIPQKTIAKFVRKDYKQLIVVTIKKDSIELMGALIRKMSMAYAKSSDNIIHIDTSSKWDSIIHFSLHEDNQKLKIYSRLFNFNDTAFLSRNDVLGASIIGKKREMEGEGIARYMAKTIFVGDYVNNKDSIVKFGPSSIQNWKGKNCTYSVNPCFGTMGINDDISLSFEDTSHRYRYQFMGDTLQLIQQINKIVEPDGTIQYLIGFTDGDEVINLVRLPE